MGATEPPKRPSSKTQRATHYLAWGFGLSVILHLLLGPFINFHPMETTKEEKPQKVTVIKVPTPPPTPPPTPKPTPTPPPTPPPKQTPPPKVTPQPQTQKIKVHTLKTTSKGGPGEEHNAFTTGSENGVPQGTTTSPAPVVKQVATPAPATPPPPTPTPKPTPACANPNVEPTTLQAAEPDMPAMAQQQGISGTVTVVVSLDAQGNVTSAKIQQSPSALLNNAALSAARQSKYRPQIENCKPVPGSYTFLVEFDSQ